MTKKTLTTVVFATTVSGLVIAEECRAKRFDSETHHASEFQDSPIKNRQFVSLYGINKIEMRQQNTIAWFATDPTIILND